MFRCYLAQKDAYITDRVIDNTRRSRANVGSAGSIDLFKLYGYTSSGSVPNLELSRALIKFDLSQLRTLATEGKLDVTSPTFKCLIKMYDVNGGQTTPEQFTLTAHPLSRSFDEGRGRDVVFYEDNDVCNFLTASRVSGQWIASGCSSGGAVGSVVDYLTTSGSTSLVSSQYFETGEEDLSMDVTPAARAYVLGGIPDEGFRIAFEQSLEQDQLSYFVKRFAGRRAYNESKRPRLIVSYDDSVRDDSLEMRVGSTATLWLHNRNAGQPSNIISGSTPITGPSSLTLKLETEISGGMHVLSFAASQKSVGSFNASGSYYSTFTIPTNDPILNSKIAASGSVLVKPIWGSLDGTVGYYTGSALSIKPADVGSPGFIDRFIVSVFGVQPDHVSTELATFRIHIDDSAQAPGRLPVQAKGRVPFNVHHQVRDAVTNDVIVPFDTSTNCTRVSSDSNGNYVTVDMNSLTVGRSYTIDVMVGTTIHRDASPTFRVVRTL